MKKLISIVVPVYNEEENVELVYNRLNEVLSPLSERYDFEFVFTDNHSMDRSFEILKELAEQDPRVRAFRFSKNFGFQRSVLTGFLLARGDAAVEIDCDLQDPPELIPEFIKLWEEGYRVVYGVREEREEGLFIKMLRKLFYRLINFLSEEPLPLDAGDFRLVDRKVLNELKRIEDATPYLRGTIASLGFRQIGVPYVRKARQFGKSKFSFSDLFKLALDGILNHSLVPLRIATFTGLVASIIALLGTIIYFVGKIFFGKNWPPGFATITILMLLSLSLNALFLGIIGEYLGRIYLQVKKRPLTIIEEKIDPTSGERP